VAGNRAVASHWVLDFVSHRPDLPLYPGGEMRFGLGLWQSIAATFAVESLMFAAGIAVYMQSTKAKDLTGAVAWWVFVALLLRPLYSGALVASTAE